MKKILLLVISLLLLSALFVSCSIGENGIVGEWKGKAIALDESGSLNISFVFTDDGRFTMVRGSAEQTGTYTIEGNVLTMVADDVPEENATLIVTFEIKDNTFTATGDTFRLELDKKDEEADKKMKAKLVGDWTGTYASTNGEESVDAAISFTSDGRFTMSVAGSAIVRTGTFGVSGRELKLIADGVEGPDATLVCEYELKDSVLRITVPGSVFTLTK